MPIYEFFCESCQKQFEKLVKLNQLPECTLCGSSLVERLSSFSAVVSTPKTQARSVAGARARAQGMKREQDNAHAEYLRKHHDDHH
jgi:putative FmdB family regulatory protein